jgi:hypothetical protein
MKVFPEARATKDVFYLGGKSEHRCSFELVGLLVDVVRFLDAKGFSVRGHREISNQIPLSICTKEGKFLFGVMLAERQAGKYNGIQLDKCLYIYKIEKGKKGKGIVDLNVLIEIADEHNEKLYGKDVEVKKYSLSKVSRNAWGGFKPGEFLIEV